MKKLIGIVAVGQGIPWAVWADNKIILSISLLAIAYGFMVFLEDVIETSTKIKETK